MDVISFANLITIRDGVQLMNFDYHRKHRFMINFHFALVDNTKDSVAAACSNRGGDITRYRRRSAPVNLKRCNKKNVKMCYTTSAMNTSLLLLLATLKVTTWAFIMGRSL